jgi:hypothetical protein
MGEITTIPILKSTRERVKVLGHKGESYDSIINRILNDLNYTDMMQRQYERLKEKNRFVSVDDIE